MEYGRVSKFDSDRAFGFITPDRGGSDIFFHVSGLDRGTESRQLGIGVAVSYDESSGPKGLKAVRVKVIVMRPEDAWPEYAQTAPEATEQGAADDVYLAAWEAARKAFFDVLRASGMV